MSTTPVPWYRQLGPGQWKAFSSAWLGYLLDGFDFVIITLVLTEIRAEFHLSLAAAATLVSAAFVSRWFGGLALGAFGDRFGRRPAMILSICCYAVGTALCGFAWSYWALFAFRAVVGIGMAGEYGSSSTYVLESWPKHLRNRASGFLLSAYPIGTILAARAYDLVVPHLGWRWLFWIGIIPVLVALWLRRALPEAHDWTEQVATRAEGSTSATVLLDRRWTAANVVIGVVIAVSLVLIFSGHAGSLYPLYIALCVLGFVAFAVQVSGRSWAMAVALMATVFCAFLYSWPIQSLLPTYLKTDLHYNAGQVANALTWAGLGYALGSCLAGSLGDRFGTRTTYVGGLVLSLVFVFPAFALGGAGIVAVWVLLFALQATSSGISGLLPKYIGDHFPVRVRAASLGFTYNVGALGGAVAPLAGAQVSAHIGLGPALIWLAGGLTLVTALLVGFNVPARLARERREQGAAAG
ncbi:SHS family sialic acid transporter-like MFS transporter [Amycolatopsis bartoniae]|uniref:MFS transporter n=1 Tax=Amycolatopsis bartoniae TaxID=941986 RepID=A0A8H9IWM2_9PSEU|nr:sialate:H+ symport family MFS transporter [Amycolatopsis bartoniae]MBB2939559.1 SHS family sialic acid transporter-like MFS transporter [Amycolatopsis bartoniae]TVT07771.1 MFS transporter [Amycolatopsis bartoniae]GHF39198.1 MFS transporter [Amycolatopsis bartoniae]